MLAVPSSYNSRHRFGMCLQLVWPGINYRLDRGAIGRFLLRTVRMSDIGASHFIMLLEVRNL